MRFRIWTLLWVIALFASAMATFGGLGIVAAVVVLFTLISSYHLSKVNRAISTLGAAAVISIVLGAIDRANHNQNRYHCLNNLKQLALATLNYDSSNHHLPLAHTLIKNKPGHSWRSAIIPYLESTPWWGSIDFTTPWDSAANMAVWQGLNIELFQCPNHTIFGTSLTSYFAVVDPRTVWPLDDLCIIMDIKDNAANTILLIEAPDKDIKWYEPRDLSFQEAIELLTTRPTEDNPVGHKVHHGFLLKPSCSLGVVFVDAHAQLIPLPLDHEIAVALLTKAGGEELDPAELQSEFKPDFDYSKIFALGLFLAIAALPAQNSRTEKAQVESSIDAQEQPSGDQV